MLHCTVRTILLIGFLCPGTGTGASGEDLYEVGQRWVYQHAGPRPGSVEPNAIDGQRIVHVVGALEEAGAKRWIIEERFTNDPKVIGRLRVDPARMLTALDIENDKGETLTMHYDPPAPYQIAEMEVGETKSIETTLRDASGRFALPVRIQIERLPDEAVTTPAGEFPDCLHLRVTSRSTFNVKIAKVPITETRERWYHASVNGLVREVYRRGAVKFLMWSQDGYEATSTLTAFDRAPVPAVGVVAGVSVAENPIPKAGDSPTGSIFCTVLPWLVLVAAVLAGGLLMVRSKTRETPRKRRSPS